MKKTLMLTVLFSAISSMSYAKTVNITCEKAGLETSNEFDLVGVATLTDVDENNIGSFHNASYSITLRKAGFDSSEYSLNVDVDGSLKVYPLGTLMADKEVIQLQSVTKGEEVEYISLVANMGDTLASQIRMKDGIVYRAKCSIK